VLNGYTAPKNVEDFFKNELATIFKEEAAKKDHRMHVWDKNRAQDDPKIASLFFKDVSRDPYYLSLESGELEPLYVKNQNLTKDDNTEAAAKKLADFVGV
jgi:hypothetical protein